MSPEYFIGLLLTITGALIVSCGVLIRLYLVDGRTSTHALIDKVDERVDGIDERVLKLEFNRVEEVAVREEILEILQRLDNVG